MCEITAALTAASAVAGFVAQGQQTDAANSVAAAAHKNAGIAAQRKYEAEQQNMIADTRAAREQGYDAAMRARESIGVAKASSASSGIDMSSISVDDVINAERAKAALNSSRVQNKIDDTQSRYYFNTEAYEQEAQSRVDATPFKSGPSPLNLVLDLGISAAKGYKNNPTLDTSKFFGG